jgi:hypothetical protein
LRLHSRTWLQRSESQAAAVLLILLIGYNLIMSNQKILLDPQPKTGFKNPDVLFDKGVFRFYGKDADDKPVPFETSIPPSLKNLSEHVVIAIQDEDDKKWYGVATFHPKK